MSISSANLHITKEVNTLEITNTIILDDILYYLKDVCKLDAKKEYIQNDFIGHHIKPSIILNIDDTQSITFVMYYHGIFNDLLLNKFDNNTFSQKITKFDYNINLKRLDIWINNDYYITYNIDTKKNIVNDANKDLNDPLQDNLENKDIRTKLIIQCLYNRVKNKEKNNIVELNIYNNTSFELIKNFLIKYGNASILEEGSSEEKIDGQLVKVYEKCNIPIIDRSLNDSISTNVFPIIFNQCYGNREIICSDMQNDSVLTKITYNEKSNILKLFFIHSKYQYSYTKDLYIAKD